MPTARQLRDFEATIRAHPQWPRALCLGDSWFNYPNINEDIEENGLTLTENACIKASFLFEKSGMPALAEDTGLEVFALNGQPGVHTARYAGEQRDPKDNMNKLLKALEGQQDRSCPI